MMKRLLPVTVGIAALVLNPFFGCGADQDFRYGADEMRAAVEGTWKLTVSATGARPAREIVLSISQATGPSQQHARRSGPIAAAAACAQRSLVKSAAACGDMSEMPLEVKLIAGGEPASGMLRVHGLKFTTGELELTLATSSVRAKIAPDGTITKISTNADEAAPTATMVRLSIAQR